MASLASRKACCIPHSNVLSVQPTGPLCLLLDYMSDFALYFYFMDCIGKCMAKMESLDAAGHNRYPAPSGLFALRASYLSLEEGMLFAL